MTTPSGQLKNLIERSRVLGLSSDQTLSQGTRQLLTMADKERRLLDHDELAQICADSGTNTTLPRHLQTKADALVEAARNHLLQEQPELTVEGGALYPKDRAEACWRDCWNFLRVITYAVATGRSQFTDSQGMTALGELYVLMNVPMEGMKIALNQLHQLTLNETQDPSEQALIRACFTHLLATLNKTAIKR